MKTFKQILKEEILDKIEYLRAKYNKFALSSYDKEENPIIGKLAWRGPANVLWLVADMTGETGDYEGSVEQWGIDKNGTIAWQYQSHCSCNWYEDGNPTIKQFAIDLDEIFHLRRFVDMQSVIQEIRRAEDRTRDDKP